MQQVLFKSLHTLSWETSIHIFMYWYISRIEAFASIFQLLIILVWDFVCRKASWFPYGFTNDHNQNKVNLIMHVLPTFRKSFHESMSLEPKRTETTKLPKTMKDHLVYLFRGTFNVPLKKVS